MNNDVITIAEGKLYQLPNPYELNGYVTSHPADATGWAPMNCYLLVENGRALLIDSGYSVAEKSVLRQLSSLIDTETPIEFFPTGLGEFNVVCNAKAITENFNVVKYYGLLDGAHAWMDFRPDQGRYGTPIAQGAISKVQNAVAHSHDILEWSHGPRQLQVFQSNLRLLPCHWSYDEETGTLFTADCFTHLSRETAQGPWTVVPGETPPTLEDTYYYYVNSRFWWLPGANTEELEQELIELFGRLDVRAIAPRWGCAMIGEEAVNIHYELLLDVLRKAREDEPTGVTAGAIPMGGRA